MAAWLTGIGLGVNLAGVILLFRYGMPYRVATNGATYLRREEDDLEEARTDGVYRRWGIIGLVGIVVGTVLQIVPLLGIK